MIKILFLCLVGILSIKAQSNMTGSMGSENGTSSNPMGCFVGTRTFAYGRNFGENVEFQTINESFVCIMYKFWSGSPGWYEYTEHGEIAPKIYAPNYTCEEARKDPSAKFDLCAVESCNRIGCNSFTPLDSCPPDPPHGLIRNGTNGTNSNLVICYTGRRTLVKGKVYFNNSTLTSCPPGTGSCVKYEIKTNTSGNPENTDSGHCVPKGHMANYNCTTAQKYANITFNDCDYKLCPNYPCNRFTSPSGCRAEPPHDVNVLPNCTLREVVNKTQRCLAPFLAQYPYSNSGQCTYNLISVAQCMKNMVVNCLNSSCPTDLDAIPGLRVVYKAFVEIGSSIDSIDDLIGELVKMPGMQDMVPNIVGLIPQYLCSAPGQKPPLPSVAEVQNISASLSSCNPVCHRDFVPDVLVAAVKFVHSYYETTSPQQQCSLAGDFFIELEDMVNRQCNVSRLGDMIDALLRILPHPYNALGPMIKKAIHVLMDIVKEIPLPNCEGGGGGDMLDCKSFYGQQNGNCNSRKAWLCEYAAWNRKAVLPFFEGLEKWLSENNEDLSGAEEPTYLDFPMDLCKYSPRICFNIPLYGSQFCYCTDHEYTNERVMHRMYSTQMEDWRKFMWYYRGLLHKHSTC